MAGARTLMLIGCLLPGALCWWEVWIPSSRDALIGSCVVIPCSFQIPSGYNLDSSCKAVWKRADGTTVFDSSRAVNIIQGSLNGNLLQKDCTTTLNIPTDYTDDKYFFRLDCNHPLRYTFATSYVHINGIDSPPRPTLTPASVEVKEGDAVSLSCSAAVLCPSLPPTLTWTPELGENQDRLATSVLTFTASSRHHRQTVSCTALYKRQDGHPGVSAETSLTIRVSYPPKNTKVSVSPSGPVLEGSYVTLTCNSDANPPVTSYTWYRIKNKVRQSVGSGENLTFGKVTSSNSGEYFCQGQNKHGDDVSAATLLDIQYPPKTPSVSVSPSGPVLEGSNVTLTCNSDANPPVNYTWYRYRVNGTEELAVGSGPNVTFDRIHRDDAGQYDCVTRNTHGTGSENVSLDVAFAAEILSSHCVRAASQINCSCEAHGNPAPRLDWRLAGRPVNHSDAAVLWEERVGSRGLRSSFTVRQSSEDTPTVVCISANSVGSRSLLVSVHDQMDHVGHVASPLTLTLVLVIVLGTGLTCALLFSLRGQKLCSHVIRRQDKPSSSHDASNQVPSSGARSEAAAAPEEDIYENSQMLNQAKREEEEEGGEEEDGGEYSAPAPRNQEVTRVVDPPPGPPKSARKGHLDAHKHIPKPLPSPRAAISGGHRHRDNQPPHMRPDTASATKDGHDDVLYSTVIWKNKRDGTVATGTPGGSHLDEQRCALGNVGGQHVATSLETESLYEEIGFKTDADEPIDCEYSQVRFKTRDTTPK